MTHFPNWASGDMTTWKYAPHHSILCASSLNTGGTDPPPDRDMDGKEELTPRSTASLGRDESDTTPPLQKRKVRKLGVHLVEGKAREGSNPHVTARRVKERGEGSALQCYHLVASTADGLGDRLKQGMVQAAHVNSVATIFAAMLSRGSTPDEARSVAINVANSIMATLEDS